MTFSYFMQTLYGSIGDNFDSQIAFFKDVIGHSVKKNTTLLTM